MSLALLAVLANVAKIALWTLVALVGAGAVCVAYGVFVERRWYRVASYRLPVLPPGSPERVSLLHLSDLHLVTGDRGKMRFLGSLPAADVTVVTGDMLGEPGAVEAVASALGPCRGEAASFFVLGSNDYFAPRPLSYLAYFRKRRRRRSWKPGAARELVSRLERDGWTHLRNRRVTRKVAGVPMDVVGLDDPHIERHDLRAAVGLDPSAFGLAVVHSPDPAPELAALGYDLVVCGHTHGGQVRLPLAGALVTNSSIPIRFGMGLSRFGRTFLHVSPGLGTSKFAPFRFLCRPEATLLELEPRAQPEGSDTTRWNAAS
jgi:predicted MPP superfamily phosphohydrolase